MSFFTGNECWLCRKCYMLKVRARKRFKVLSEKELVKNKMYLVWELNPWLSVHEADTLQSELMRFTSAKSGSNRRPSELQSDALPTELLAEPIEQEHKSII